MPGRKVLDPVGPPRPRPGHVLSESHAISSFVFRDSIVTSAGELLQSQGPTTLIWERREGVWKLLFGDADHYGIPDAP